MDRESKSNSSNKYPKRDSLVIFVLLLVLIALVYMRIEVVHRGAEVMKAGMDKRIQRIEEEMEANVQTIVKKMLQTKLIPTSLDARNYGSLGKSITVLMRDVSIQYNTINFI